MQALPARMIARVAAGAVAAALVAAGLTGCAGSAGSGGCTPLASSGLESDAVAAHGAFGAAPKVSFPLPTHATSTTQATTLIEGTGAPIRSTQEVVADLTLLDGTTGAVLTKTSYKGASGAATFVLDKIAVPGVGKALACSRVGSRVAMVVPPKQGFAAASRPATVKATDSLVAVVDVRRAYLDRADGTNQVMASGLPAVVLAPNGQPGVSIPDATPPSTLRVADLKTGSGAVINRGDTAIVQYTGVLWGAGGTAGGTSTVFDSSWTAGSPVALPVKAGTSGIIPGLATALAGRRVGSQVLAVIPPKLGYGSAGQGSIPGGSTLVFVVDLLGKQ